MKKFFDKRNHYPKLEARDGDIFLRTSNFEQKLDNDEISYYLSNFSINSGYMNNIFKLVIYEDGTKKFHERTHQSYRDAEKEARITIKEINEGDILISKYDRKYIYLGSFYLKGQKTKRRFFLDLNNNHIISFSTLNKFVDIGDFIQKYADVDDNISFLKKNRCIISKTNDFKEM